ncbi:MAG: hypothetical protein WD851_01470 [Pirellulales bacterium]
MKSEHRHELETNTLARHLSKWIDSSKPYAQAAALGALAIVVGLLLWSWVGRSSAGRQDKDWLDYNMAVEGPEPDLELLKKSADDHADTPVGALSELTWADGQLFRASNSYLTSKTDSKEFLEGATKAYEELIRTASDPLLVSRAHFGLGRAYEMQPDLEKAKSEYAKVTGPFEPLAKQRLARLKSNQAAPAIEWLAIAEAPRRVFPAGPGTPGVRPDFQVDDLATPEAESEATPSFDDILKRLGETQPDSGDRYDPPGDQPPPGVTEETPPTDPQPPTEEPQATEPESTPPATDPAAEPPTEEAPSAEPAAEENPFAEAPPVETPQL